MEMLNIRDQIRYVAGEGNTPSDSMNVAEAESILSGLASVFFPADAALGVLQGSYSDSRGGTIQAAELPNAVARYHRAIRPPRPARR